MPTPSPSSSPSGRQAAPPGTASPGRRARSARMAADTLAEGGIRRAHPASRAWRIGRAFGWSLARWGRYWVFPQRRRPRRSRPTPR